MDAQQNASPEVSRDTLSALASIRSAKTFFLVVVVLCVATHVGAWVAVDYGRVLDARHAAVAEESPAGGVAGTPAAAAPSEAERASAERAHRWMQSMLPLTEFLGRIAALLLCVTMLTAALVALVGRFPVAGYIKGFFRALVASALLVPWERLTLEGPRLTGVFTDLAALEAPLEISGLPAVSPALPIIRFVAYPVLVLGIFALANGQFGRSFREAAVRPGANIPMRVV